MTPRIMVIDGMPEICVLFQELLVKEGYEVMAYADAMQDLVEVERVQRDLIILGQCQRLRCMSDDECFVALQNPRSAWSGARWRW